MIVEDQLDRSVRRIGGIDKPEEFDELSTAVAILDKGVDLAGEQINPSQLRRPGGPAPLAVPAKHQDAVGVDGQMQRLAERDLGRALGGEPRDKRMIEAGEVEVDAEVGARVLDEPDRPVRVLAPSHSDGWRASERMPSASSAPDGASERSWKLAPTASTEPRSRTTPSRRLILGLPTNSATRRSSGSA